MVLISLLTGLLFLAQLTSGFLSLLPEKTARTKTPSRLNHLLGDHIQAKNAVRLFTLFLLLALLFVCVSARPDFHPGVPAVSTAVLLVLVLASCFEGLARSLAERSFGRLQTFLLNPAYHIYRLLSPLTRSASRVLGANDILQEELSTESELEQALELNYAENEPGPQEHQFLQGIVKFGNKEVWQVMTPRTEVVAVQTTLSFAQVLAVIRESGYSRMPVITGEKVTGALYIKDLLACLETPETEWQRLIREPYFVPGNKKIVDLLEEFQQRKRHQAIVVNEYGDWDGLITLEDIVEEIVGDISDEFDEEEVIYSRIDDHSYIFEAKTPLSDFYKITGASAGEFEAVSRESGSIAGFLLEQTGRIPQKNETISFGKYTFVIESADRRRVKRVKVTISKV